MKIVCESCGAKYSIADEKVAGKVFKIRCKRCSEVIVVRGDEGGAPASTSAAPAAYDASPQAIWHVVINGDQQGPYTPVQLGEMLTNGTVDWEAYVWMEGFDNWLPMRDVEHLVAEITGGGQQEEARSSQVSTSAGGYGAAAQDAYSSQPSMGADPFADDGDAAPFGGGGEVAAAASSGPDLFGGGAAASPFDGGGDAGGGVVASSPSPRVDADQASMTGTRNENSVLFSLKNLQALATGPSTTSSAPAAGGGGDLGGGAALGGAGFATGEGSGLIDIRALASATGMSGADQGGGQEKDDLLSMGNQTAAFGALGASPMLATTQDESEGGNKTVLFAAIFGGVAVLIAAGVFAWAILNKPPEKIVEKIEVEKTVQVPVPANAGGEATDEEGGEEPEGEGAQAAKDEEDGDDRSAKRERTKERRRKSGSSSGSSSSGSSAKADSNADAPKEAPKPRKSGGGDSLDDLLNQAVGGGGGSKPKPKAGDNLPDAPSKSEVLKALKGVEHAVKACAAGAHGVAYANITVKGKTGRVTGAQIEGQTGAVGSCIARAVRKARFPKFKNETFKVKYPYRL